MNKMQILSLALTLLLGVLLGVCLHGAAAETLEEPAPFRLGLQDNALDRLFGDLAEVVLRPELSELMLEIFKTSILTGFQFAFPLVAMELVTEAAVGILMRMIPQINVFAVNFQIKIAVGLMMLVYLFSPMGTRIYVMLDDMFLYMQRLIMLMR